MMGGISLVIPVFNETNSIRALLHSISEQSLQPNEVILVDGGSTDDTIDTIRSLIALDPKFKLISVDRALPGRGRNIGTSAASNEWIAYTDAGIELDKDWLFELSQQRKNFPGAEIIYGNLSPNTNSFFEKCASISYVAPKKNDRISTRSIASCLMKKQVWEKVGGFSDWRAAEDLIFIDNAEKLAKGIAYAPKAWVHWELRKDLKSTFKKFYLYSTYNVWAGRQHDWHYGIARQYLLALIFFLAALFYSYFFWLFFPAWFLARALKRAIMHRESMGNSVFDPRVLFMVMLILFTIDMATFGGWLKALLNPGAIRRSTFR